MVGIVTAVGDEAGHGSRGLDQPARHRDIVGVSCRQQQHARSPEGIGHTVDLGGPAPARAAYGLSEGPPFAPAAERCALMWVASIETIPPGP